MIIEYYNLREKTRYSAGDVLQRIHSLEFPCDAQSIYIIKIKNISYSYKILISHTFTHVSYIFIN